MLRTLDKYELLEEIGHGGMATVYRARDTRLDRLVAIKVLHPHLQKTPEARKRFTREAQSVAKLSHPGILEIYDYSGDDSPESYIAAELLTGPTLKRLVDDGEALPPEVAAAMAIQIARALEAAHKAHIVHRDVKPENVLLHEDRCVKLTDFGIAQMVDAQSMTATGQILGSPGHMAPEQVSSGDIDERSDVFSLGTVLYFMATGRLPFMGRNPHQVLRRIMEGEYADPVRIRPAIGAELGALIQRSMQVDPEQRPSSAAAFADELAAFLMGVDLDDPNALVERYLADPAATRAALHASVLKALMARARTALKNKQRGETLACLNRVLAMEDGHKEALELLERLGRRKRVVPWVVATTAALVIGVGAWWVMSDPPGAHGLGTDVTDAGIADSGVADSGTTDTIAAEDTNPAIDAGDNASNDEDAGAEDAATEDTGAEDGAAEDSASEDTGPRRPRPRTPRRVVFQPTPRNVSIAVDDGPLRPYGPGFREIELSPGRHRFRIVGAENCCEDLDFVQTIPSGSGPFELRRTLAYRPALLVVYSDVLPAEVSVAPAGNAQGASGTAGTPLRVPLGARRQSRRVTVSAAGHTPISRNVELRAGTANRVTLSPRPSP